jgi:hypothetical protein
MWSSSPSGSLLSLLKGEERKERQVATTEAGKGRGFRVSRRWFRIYITYQLANTGRSFRKRVGVPLWILMFAFIFFLV